MINVLLLFLTTFILGVRHGIDLDHLAAITDITGSSSSKKHSIILGLFYALGHGSIVVVLGVLAVILGLKLPGLVEVVIEPIIGVTLIFLGIWLIISICKDGSRFRFKSKWGVLFPDTFNKKAAYTMGVIHGIGVETPTQVLLFITAAGIGGGFRGIVLLIIFVLGLFIANSLIMLITTFSFSQSRHIPFIYPALGLVSAFFSIGVGLMFLANQAIIIF